MAELEALEDGELVWVEFDPAVGREQKGRRPALVVSKSLYHSTSSYAIVCPITRNKKPWPYKVNLPDEAGIKGAVLVDQVKSIDRRHRVFGRVGRVPDEVMHEVRGKLAVVVGITLAPIGG